MKNKSFKITTSHSKLYDLVLHTNFIIYGYLVEAISRLEGIDKIKSIRYTVYIKKGEMFTEDFVVNQIKTKITNHIKNNKS